MPSIFNILIANNNIILFPLIPYYKIFIYLTHLNLTNEIVIYINQ